MTCPDCGSSDYGVHENLGSRRRLKCKDCGKSWTVENTPTRETSVSDESSNTSRTITTRSADITTLDQLIAYSKVDMSAWEVQKHLINSWEVTVIGPDGTPQTYTNYQVKAWFSAVDNEELTIAEVIEQFKAAASGYSPDYPKIKRKKINDGRLMVISLFDHHFGQLSWGDETGGENYDIKIAKGLAVDAVDYILSETDTSRIERILLPIGNDFFNVNNSNNTTFAGTPQSEDDRFKKTFKSGLETWVEIIDRLSTIAPVDIPIVVGNHDEERSFYLGVALECWYRRCDYVTVDNSPMLKKPYAWGNTLLGLTHGDKEIKGALANIMATLWPEKWAKSKYRTWLCGHLHAASAKAFQVLDEQFGVRIEVLPSLVATDDWHAGKGYSHMRETVAAEYSKTKGRVSQTMYHP